MKMICEKISQHLESSGQLLFSYLDTMKELIKVVLSFWLYPTISFVLVVVLFINELLRTTLSVVLRLIYNGNVFLVSDGADTVWEYKTPGNTRMVLVCFITRRGHLDNAKTCVKTLEDRLFRVGTKNGVAHNNPSYQKLQNVITRKFGYTCWKRDQNFNVKRHIRTLDRDFEYTEKDVMNMLAGLTKDMDEQKPQWEWVILPKYIDSKGEKKSLQVFRYHHAYMDGMSGLMLISKLSDNFNYLLDPIKYKTALWKKIYFYTNCVLFAPTTLIRLYYNKYQTYWNRRYFRKRNPGFRRRRFMAWTNGEIELETLKRIRFDCKASIQSIVAFAFVEACKTILPKKRLVKEMLVAEEIAFFPYPNSDPQNRSTAFTYPIALEENGQSLFQRLRDMQRSSLAGIGGPEPLVIYYIAKIAGRFPYLILPYLFSGAHSSIQLSNVPSAKDKFRYFSADCEELAAFPPMPDDTGLSLSCLSYKGGLKICGQADSSCLSEQELRQIFNEIPNVIDSIAQCSAPIVCKPVPDETPERQEDSPIPGSRQTQSLNSLSPPQSRRAGMRKSASPRRRQRKRTSTAYNSQ